MSMDATTEATLNSFFAAAPQGNVNLTMAGDKLTHVVPASMSEVGSFVDFNSPVNSVGSLNFSSLLDHDGGVDLSRISGPENNSGPQLRGTNYAAVKPKTPGFS